MTDSRLTPLGKALPATVPFVGPESQERDTGRPFRARIGANESVFGPAPGVIDAMRAAAPDIWKYPDAQSHDLRTALAAHHGVAFDSIMTGCGVDGLLGDLVRLYVAKGDAVVTSAGAYPTFNYHVAGFGGDLVTVPFKGDREDPDALIAKAAEVGAKLIYLSNPDNPMGTWHSAAKVQQMIDAVPEGSLLVLDEAYTEFAPEGTAPPFDTTDPRVIRLRTFSKAYGMAGARVGYAVSTPEIVSGFNKIRNHFGMNRTAQIGALAAVQDQDYLAEVISRTGAARDRIAGIAADNGLAAIPSATNFVAVDCGRDGDFARAVLGALVADGIFVRMPFVAPQDRCIRISAGEERDLEALAEALPRALAIAGG